MPLYHKGEVLCGSSGPEEVYSTEEVRIGTWIDGKPLYRVVIQFHSVVSQNWTVVAPPIQDANVHEISAWIDFDGGAESLPLLLFYNGGWSYMRLGYSPTGSGYAGSPGFLMLNTQNSWDKKEITAICEYTKTTD